MEFEQPRAIFQQIAEQMRDRILQREYVPRQRIPSVRELAVELGVNPNTVNKSYQALTDIGVIENRRGLGYFVTDAARELILAEMKREFLSDELPRVLRTMRLLGMDEDELTRALARQSNRGEES